jgi:hypothetical protein
MTQDEIMKMARLAGFEGCAELTWENVICTEELVAFAKLVAQHEREACANVCDEQMRGKSIWIKGAEASALAIRARSKE